MTSLPEAWVALPSELRVEVRPSEEEQVWSEVCAGDARALRRLYERHAPCIRRFLRDLLRDEAAACDATQETFARAFRRLATLRDGDRLRPWLFGIARNVGLEVGKARATARRRLAPLRDEGDEDVDSLDPETLLLGCEAASRLGTALETLREERRAAQLLRADHGLAYEEVAALMGWTLAKVKVEIHRARRQLRLALAEPEPGAPRARAGIADEEEGGR
ncbi:MAG: RNA polymerase sigma factor [Polyangiaceae bacterium]